MPLIKIAAVFPAFFIAGITLRRISDYHWVKDAPVFFALRAIPENPNDGTFLKKGERYGMFGVAWIQ